MNINTEVKFMPGEECWVRNYRRKWHPYELGVVSKVEICLYGDGRKTVTYAVRINRVIKTTSFFDRSISLHVSEEKITKHSPL